MNRGIIKLENAQRFTDGYEIPKDKLKKSIDVILDKLKAKAEIYKDQFPGNITQNCRYELIENNNWIHGMHTGCYLLAYELSGDKIFLDVAKHQLDSYKKRIDENICLDDHDVGFVYSPSCVYYYRLTGDKYAYDMALEAANILYDRMYSEKGGFIMRVGLGKTTTNENHAWACRTMMDTMMNIPLFFWAYGETGDEKFKKAALAQCKTTDDYLVRADGSTYHHYQFEVGTHKPLYGVTFQGNRDESTWTRGHSWGVVGYPWAYNYSPEEYMPMVQRDLTYYFLNTLPSDFIPYWDTDFSSGDEPRDTSAGAVVACGLLSAIDFMPLTDEEKSIYRCAANKIIDSTIDKFTTPSGEEYDGLLYGVTPARKMEQYEVETCALYGDYFFLEALTRLYNPDWKRTW